VQVWKLFSLLYDYSYTNPIKYVLTSMIQIFNYIKIIDIGYDKKV